MLATLVTQLNKLLDKYLDKVRNLKVPVKKLVQELSKWAKWEIFHSRAILYQALLGS